MKLASAIPPVKQICRFRSVGESSLDQLRSNKLAFSSADHYDDPFDTYFYIDYDRVLGVFEALKTAYEKGGTQAIVSLFAVSGMNPAKGDLADFALSHIDQNAPRASLVEEKILSLRAEVQKRCYSICFCDDPLNESLWLKYADSHKGFVQVYNLADDGIIRCGKSESCKTCMFDVHFPAVYPVHYSDDRYDATKYVMTELVLKELPEELTAAFPSLRDTLVESIAWEIERISLVKRKCHEHDSEWRMICPFHPSERPFIGMKPSYVIVGMRMPEYERGLVASAAEVAGIRSIYEAYIDRSDHLAIRLLE